jgi:hypothetical protein
MNEELQKAIDAAKLAARDLREALAKANAVEAMLLITLISDAEGLAAAVAQLLNAKNQHD